MDLFLQAWLASWRDYYFNKWMRSRYTDKAAWQEYLTLCNRLAKLQYNLRKLGRA